MKKSSSSTRYYASVAAMFLVIMVSIVTFTKEYSNYKDENSSEHGFQLSQIEQEYAEAVISDSNNYWESTFVGRFRTYFDRNLPLIVVIWNLIVLVLLLKTIGGLAYSQRLKSYKTSVLSEQWASKIAELSKQLGIKRSIQILESAIIKVPVVIGSFKPVILMPIGIVSGLSHEQIEAILAHELAHIKRNDYLVNIFQSIVEVLFFYHPAIWWISKNIRNERENACDDIAILANIDRKALAKALTNLEVLNQEKTLLALAFSGNKTSLLNRVKRILNPQKTKVTMKEGFITICILLASLSIMSFSSNVIKNSNENKHFAKSIKKSETQVFNQRMIDSRFREKINETGISNEILSFYRDTIIKKDNNRGDISYSLSGKKYRLVFDNGKNVKAFYVNNKEIPKSKWGNYKKEIDYGFLVLKKHEIEMKKHEEKMRRHEEDMAKRKKEMKAHEEEMKKHEKELIAREMELKKHQEKLAQHEQEMKEHEKEMTEHEGEMAEHEREMVEHEREMTKHEKKMIEHEKQMKIHEHKMQIVEGLIEKMKKDGLIDKNAISYKIIFTENELIINEKKQSSKVHKKYKQMFDEKSKGKHKLDIHMNVNPNFYGKNREEVLKMRLEGEEKNKQKLVENLKKLEVQLKELTLKKEAVQKESKINEGEKEKILEKITQHYEEIKKEQQLTELKMKQLIFEYEHIRKEYKNLKEK